MSATSALLQTTIVSSAFDRRNGLMRKQLILNKVNTSPEKSAFNCKTYHAFCNFDNNADEASVLQFAKSSKCC